ncbi:MAG: glycosyltransferase [Clostridiales bacterium]|nr:glycosyltransferase [Clostridiales bacterium]
MIRKLVLAGYGIIHNTWFIFHYSHSDIKNIIISRTIFPRFFPFYASFLVKRFFKGRNVIWDFDDNIIADREITKKELEILIKYAKRVVVSNEYLKSTLPYTIHSKVNILCTTDHIFAKENIDTYIRSRMETYSKKIYLIWLGTRDNVKYLGAIMSSLDLAAKELREHYDKELILRCVSNTRVACECKYLRVENHVWSRHGAIELLKHSHVGLMPLQNNKFTLGKAAFKAVQYISAGMPAIVSDVGYCKEVITNDMNGYRVSTMNEWKDAVVALATDEAMYGRYSIAARECWEDKFESHVNQTFWEEILKS